MQISGVVELGSSSPRLVADDARDVDVAPRGIGTLLDFDFRFKIKMTGVESQ